MKKQMVDDPTINPESAIWTFCAECMGGSLDEVTKCDCNLCPLYPHRPAVGIKPIPSARLLAFYEIMEREKSGKTK